MPSEVAPTPRLRARAVVWLLAGLLLLALRLASVYSETINWDEFALLHRAVQTERSGVLHAGGRPGLSVLLLIPLVGSCDDEIAIVQRARVVWVFVTAVFLAGLWRLLRRSLRHTPHATQAAALGVALLALTPTFVQWSLQVRTDQLALAAGVWGGVALLASRRRPGLAALAGLLFGLGYLCTQKLVYVAALVGLLALLDLRTAPAQHPRRELARGLLAAGCALGVILAYKLLLPLGLRDPSAYTVARELDTFAFYRRWVGWSQYRAILPTLLPHAALGLALIAAAGRGRARGLELVGPAAVAALGLAVGLFHAGAYFYFWMTLGLFPAVALALGYEPSLRLFSPAPARARALFLGGVWLVLAAQGAFQLGLLLQDTQAEQRAALRFVARNFARTEAGFQPENALFCQDAGKPFPTFFSQQVHARFEGPDGPKQVEAMREQFAARPVRFIVGSWRLGLFPEPLQRFWHENYQPYRRSIWVAGRRLSGRTGERIPLELVASGEYRWLPFADPTGRAPGGQVIELDGTPLEPTRTRALAAGRHEVVLRDDVPLGLIVLALSEAPQAGRGVFYAGARSSLIGRY